MQFAHFRFDPEADRLGEGPLSEVYRAVDERLGRTVALKILRAHAEIDPEADTRFLNEAKHASNLVHSNIATVYEYGRDQNTSYIAMEYLKGRTLDKILQTRTLGYEECLRVGLQVTAALAVVHHAGLIHRDLKPGNIMVQDDGTVKLLDFGIARATDEAGITQHGVMVGTVLYMSPEQVRGEDLDFRSDIFALGSVLYQVMTNTLPFPGRSFPEVCMAILDGTVKPPTTVRQGLPQSFEGFVMKCLRPDPGDRFQTTDDAQHALMSIAELLKVTHGTNLANRIQGKLLILPFDCSANSTGSCHVLAGGLRKDIGSELDRVKGLDVELFDGDPLQAGAKFEWVMRAMLDVQGSGGALDFVLEHYADQKSVHNTFREVIRHQEDDEWALQADLTRSTVRVVRKQLAEFSLRPVQEASRDTEESTRHVEHAHDVLMQGTSKSLMASISSFRRAIEADPYCAIAYAGMAEAMVRKYLYWDGDTEFLEEARENAQRALALDPDCAEAHTSLGYAHHLSGHAADAQREYRLAIQRDNNEWLAHRLLGELLMRDGNFQGAAPLLRRAIALKPEHIASYDALYTVFARLDRYEEALEIADKGISAARRHLKTVPENQDARLYLALLLARIAESDEARSMVEESRRRRPKDGYTAFLAARVHAVLGEVEASMAALEQAQARGFYVQSGLIRNTDLDVLRGRPEFEAIAT